MADRADEMVIAGMKPHSYANSINPYHRLHRGITFILLVDSFIVLLFLYEAALILSPNSKNPIAIVSAILLLVNFLGYRKRSPKSYWLGGAVIGLAGVFLGIWALLNLLLMHFLMTFLLGWAMLGSFRRSLSHFHQGYKKAYHGQAESLPGLELELGEMLAACPHCMAILAIRPDLLNPKDDCPYCKMPLVSSKLAARYEEE